MMQTAEDREIRAQFDHIRALVTERLRLPEGIHNQGLPQAVQASVEDLAAYNALRYLFLEDQLRGLTTEEKKLRGNQIYLAFFNAKRSTNLSRKIFQDIQDALKRAGQLSAVLCKPWEGTPKAYWQTVCELIAALRTESVTAKMIHKSGETVLFADQEKNTKKKQQEDAAFTFEFDQLWKRYPKKQGKKDALKAYKKARRNGTTYEAVEEGLLALIENIKRNKTEPQYIKQGSTWFNGEHWNDDYSLQPARESVYSSDASYDLEAYRKSAIGLRGIKKEETA